MHFGHIVILRIVLSIYYLENSILGRRLCGVVCKLITFFDGEVISPMRHFDVSFKLVDIGDWCSIFEMDTNFL